jgi:hypothetical protein
MLSPERAEEIPGASDPQSVTDLAHQSARALVTSVRASTDPQVVGRVVHLARTEGVDDIAELWSQSPAGTLPGTLWRLYALHAWVHQDPVTVARLYDEGARTIPGLQYLAGVERPPGVDEIRGTIDEILRGAFEGDFPLALERASAVLTLVAHGTAHQEDTAVERASALLTTAEDLSEAARLAREGDLS